MRPEDVERRKALVARLVELRASGRLNSATVDVAARSAGVRARTVWRWISEGDYAPRKRAGWSLTAEARYALDRAHGRTTIAWRMLQNAGVDVPSRKTFERAVERELSLAERAYLRNGENGRRRYELYLRWEPSARNEVWEMDHAQLDIHVLPVRGKRLATPWLTVVIDGYSRVVMGWALSLHPTAAEVLAALREAIVVDPRRGPWGGVPELVRFDGGLEFLSHAVSRAAGEVGFAARPTAPYSPHQKGKVERLHRTIGEGLIATLPHYTGAPRRRNGELYAQPAPLSLPQLQARIRDFIQDYNTKHLHASLGGMTPAQRWDASLTPLDVIEPERLRWMLMADATRKVLKTGIRFGGETFLAPALARVVGSTVQVRYMPHDLRSIEVSTEGGGWLCTAYPVAQLSDEQKRAVVEQRQEAAREMGRRKAAASRRARARTEPLTGDTPVTDITVVSRRSANSVRPSSDKRSNKVLKVLGLTDRLNKAIQPDDDAAGGTAA